MHRAFRFLGSLSLAVALFSPLATVGCAEHHYYRVYDPAYGDYHRWDAHEDVYYHQWVTENHRDNRDFRKLNADEQKQYWSWRHSHDHDH